MPNLIKYDPGFAKYLRVILFLLLPVAFAIVFVYKPHHLMPVAMFFRNDIKQPVRKAVCLTASKVDFSGREAKYISRHDIKEIKRLLKPGDIVFHRNESQLSNFAISGFWTHTGIYIGGRDEINEYFAAVNLPGYKKPSDYLEKNYPHLFRKLVLRRHLVIEAVGEGVVINPVDRFANADYFAAVRPEISREKLFAILINAFENYGKPYDFFFDFSTDDALVCSEFVYKCFNHPEDGIHFRLKYQNNKPFLTPNDIALQTCSTDASASPAFRFVVFYGGEPETGTAGRKDIASFRMVAME